MFRYLIPLFVFIGLVLLFIIGLGNDPAIVPSPFIDKPLPTFSLPELNDPSSMVRHSDLSGEITLLNVWATWCIPCRHEHPLLMDLARNNNVRIYGLNYKDDRASAIKWLQEYGDPYRTTMFDEAGSAAIDLGVYGVPETFILDKDGIIRYKHIGPLTLDIVNDTILPVIGALRETG